MGSGEVMENEGLKPFREETRGDGLPFPFGIGHIGSSGDDDHRGAFPVLGAFWEGAVEA